MICPHCFKEFKPDIEEMLALLKDQIEMNKRLVELVLAGKTEQIQATYTVANLQPVSPKKRRWNEVKGKYEDKFRKEIPHDNTESESSISEG